MNGTDPTLLHRWNAMFGVSWTAKNTHLNKDENGRIWPIALLQMPILDLCKWSQKECLAEPVLSGILCKGLQACMMWWDAAHHHWAPQKYIGFTHVFVAGLVWEKQYGHHVAVLALSRSGLQQLLLILVSANCPRAWLTLTGLSVGGGFWVPDFSSCEEVKTLFMKNYVDTHVILHQVESQ